MARKRKPSLNTNTNIRNQCRWRVLTQRVINVFSQYAYISRFVPSTLSSVVPVIHIFLYKASRGEVFKLTFCKKHLCNAMRLHGR